MANQKINEIPSDHWCSDRERHIRKLKRISHEPDNIKIFVEETHLNMVLRMMHFYDLLIIKKSNQNSYEDVTNVLKFIGWNYHGIDEQFKVFFNDLNIDFSKQLTREQIRYIFKLWIYKVSSEPVLLLKCFTYFDYNSDAYISKDEMLKILYRTIEERRIKLKNDLIPKLNVDVSYKRDLGFALSDTVETKPNKNADKVIITKKKRSFKFNFQPSILIMMLFHLSILISFILLFFDDYIINYVPSNYYYFYQNISYKFLATHGLDKLIHYIPKRK